MGQKRPFSRPSSPSQPLIHTHFSHELAAMDFYRGLTRSDFSGYLFTEKAENHQRQDLFLLQSSSPKLAL